MKKYLLILSALAMGMTAMAQAPAFPGAEGVARWTTTGGRGGKIIHVTNLNDSGTGSLRAACTANGARIVVFDVSGVIELKSQLKISNPNITIEGQTAPGDGICLKDYTFNISASNVIVRFIRSRMGDAVTTKGDDAMNAYFHTGGEKNNIIIDHCSMSWSTDECGSFYGIKNFTLQWCVLSESLANSIHEKGAHGYGGIWGGQNAAYHHNLLASHTSRNPRFDHDYVNNLKGPVDFVNNVIYNWGGNSTYGGESCNTTGNYKMYNMINNYYKAGSTSSHKSRIVNPTTKCTNCTGENTGLTNLVPGHFYVTGNYVDGFPAVTADNWQGVEPDDASKKASIKSETRFIPTGYDGQTLITQHNAETAFDRVMSYVGACYKRDVIDQRISNETSTGTFTYYGSNGSTGGFIDTPSDVGGWPTYKEKSKLTDSDNDGMPDVWETANGLDPNNADDAKTYTLDSKGWYTNIEVYCNALVEDLVKAQNEGAESKVEEYYPAVQKAAGVEYYDEDVMAEGGYEQADGTQGQVVWSLKNNTNAEVGSSIADGIASTSFSTGSNVSTNGNGTYHEVRFTLITATTPHTNATEDDAVKFSLTTNSGYEFKATNIQLTACKVGTDKGNFNAKWTDVDGTKAVINGAEPNRNNDAGGYFSTYNQDVSALTTATSGTCKLTLYPYNVGFYDANNNIVQKNMGFANVIIKGTLVNSAGIGTLVTTGTPVSTKYYDIMGRSMTSSQRGVSIRVEHMPDGSVRTRKVIR